jgi:hypothetical protein
MDQTNLFPSLLIKHVCDWMSLRRFVRFISLADHCEWDNPGYITSMVEHGTRYHAHDALGPAAVD